mmetsp:Transcript_12770/g.31059  ORF Transcript_12770/g.31059 Transcript_12770/m.31059 type:complete len:219 (-) Transcript_12770:567-1223(-)
MAATQGCECPAAEVRSLDINRHALGCTLAATSVRRLGSYSMDPRRLSGRYAWRSWNVCRHLWLRMSHTRIDLSIPRVTIWFSTSLISTSTTLDVCPTSWPMLLTEKGFHSNTLRSMPHDTRNLSLGDQSIACTPLLWPLSVRTAARRSTSVMTMVRSREHEPTASSSVMYSTLFTQSSCVFCFHSSSKRTRLPGDFSLSVLSMTRSACTYPPSSPSAM